MHHGAASTPGRQSTSALGSASAANHEAGQDPLHLRAQGMELQQGNNNLCWLLLAPGQETTPNARTLGDQDSSAASAIGASSEHTLPHRQEHTCAHASWGAQWQPCQDPSASFHQGTAGPGRQHLSEIGSSLWGPPATGGLASAAWGCKCWCVSCEALEGHVVGLLWPRRGCGHSQDPWLLKATFGHSQAAHASP